MGRWVLDHMIAPLVPLLLLLAITYFFDLSGLRSNQVTNSINEIERAIQSAHEYYDSFSPAADYALKKASDHKWAAIEARDSERERIIKRYREAYSEIEKAREYIAQTRDIGYGHIYVPPSKPWWEEGL